MFSNRRIRGLLVGCTLPLGLALVVAAPAPAAAQTDFAQIVVFGDSLSDPGNAFAFIHTGVTPPDYSFSDPFLVPGAPYARGGHRFSNGAIWIDYLARPLGLAGSVRPAFQSASPYAANYAIGTARAREGATLVTLSMQVGAFLQDVGGVAPSDALYVIEIGGNDVRDALIAGLSGGNAAGIVLSAVASIDASIRALYAAGARHFLVWNSSDIGVTPAVRTLDALSPLPPGTVMQFATQLAQLFNANLALMLAQLPLSGLPEIAVVPFDAFGLLVDIVSDPATYGLSNVTSACVTPNVPPFRCQPPDQYLFWDGVHPTTAVHAIIADTIAALLQ